MRAILLGLLGKIPRPTPAMGVALVALFLAASGAAVAAIPSSDGTITACRDTRTGALRVINAEGGQTCTTKETQLAWKNGITGKVANSDLLDGQDSSGFYAAGSKVADSSHADLADSATSAQNAANAGTLDGKDAAQFFQGVGQTVDGRATMSSDSTAPVTTPVTNIPGFGSISVVQQFEAPGNNCSAVFRNDSGGQLFRLGIRDNRGTVSSGVGNVDPSFGNGGEIELAGSDARPRGGFGTWQIVTPDMGKVLTLTVSAHFGVPGAGNTECEVAVQGAYREY